MQFKHLKQDWSQQEDNVSYADVLGLCPFLHYTVLCLQGLTQTVTPAILPDRPRPCAVHLSKALHPFCLEDPGTLPPGGRKLE